MIPEELADIICQDAGSELVLLAALVSLSIGHNLSAYEQNLFGNFLQVIGENLCMMSIRKSKCKTELERSTNTKYNDSTIHYHISNDTQRN